MKETKNSPTVHSVANMSNKGLPDRKSAAVVDLSVCKGPKPR